MDTANMMVVAVTADKRFSYRSHDDMVFVSWSQLLRGL